MTTPAEVEPVASTPGTVRDGFLLVAEERAADRSRRWVALNHVVAVVEYPDVPGRCGVYVSHGEGWMCDLSAETVRQTIAWWTEQQRRLGSLRA